ncbi:hypothetical protein DH2020_002642 [Rehmannia glutinosa]|uniref:Bifunctional inhibitor/plant lipid transfer protein/seed storage helical domain-containing protein n=1 Tax=Rehmannia glutinosa TaxID=99300 RepID=A0ABR0XUB7_REHGL
MDFHTINTRFPLLLVIISVLLAFASSDNSRDKDECAGSLVGLATCLPYVGGTANAPTQDCCGGLKQLLRTNKKCLCVIIKDRNDPNLGLTINVTLALGLPQVCNAPANISQCPALLNLPPDSPDAQIFYQVGQNSTNGSSSSSPVAGEPNVNVNANPTSAQQKSGASGYGKRNMGLGICGGLGALGFILLSHAALLKSSSFFINLQAIQIDVRGRILRRETAKQ